MDIINQPTRGFGLDLPETSPTAVPETELLENPSAIACFLYDYKRVSHP
ncbi:hypothetical protein [Nostoc sp. MS1]|nr:hypothetical protein [Nostoc sp. MS1]